MSDFLHKMAELSADRAANAMQIYEADRFDKPVFPITLNGFDVIAEIKDRSPSEGALNVTPRSRTLQAADYIEGGAAAISVLTEPSHFGGDLAHLEEVVAIAEQARVPVMRKDFLVDTLQVLEARAAGASGVLLIAAMLSDKQLSSMLDCAAEHSMFVLLESFDEQDLRRTIDLLETDRYSREAEQGRLLAGVNTRNLRTLQVDPQRLETLSSMLPSQMICVAESGLHDAADAAKAASMGYRMALIGTALMRSDNPTQLLADIRTAGRIA